MQPYVYAKGTYKLRARMLGRIVDVAVCKAQQLRCHIASVSDTLSYYQHTLYIAVLEASAIRFRTTSVPYTLP